MASYADARKSNGYWRLRIDDIDPPRAMPGAEKQIPRTLNNYGFNWDGEIIYQSERSAVYQHALKTLNQHGLLYPCGCSRRKLQGEAIYPGHCKPASTASQSQELATKQVQHKLSTSDNNVAIRVIMDASVSISDAIQGTQHFEAGEQFGDTVLVRRDELFSYALCCAVDDAAGFNHIVRGFDLLPTTAVQVRLMELLNLPVPNYAHIPVAINQEAQKLSKQTHAETIDSMPILPTLFKAWEFLGQEAIQANTVDAFWTSAIRQWQIERVPKHGTINANL